MLKRLILIMIFTFLLGWLSNSFFYEVQSLASGNSEIAGFVSAHATKEKPSPTDRIKESQIHVYKDRIVLDIENAEWSTFTDTNSMDPIIDAGANAIHIVPKSPQEISIGDIVAYDSEYASGTLIHRVIEIGADSEGIYYIMKGDNNPYPDPGLVRYPQIRRVLVGIIY